MFFRHHFFYIWSYSSYCLCVTASSHAPATFLAHLFLCRPSMQIFSILCYFKLTLLFPSATYNPVLPLCFPSHPPLPLPDSPPWCCMHFITFGSANLKKKRIYANVGLKNECSPPLQCAEECSEAPHYNIFSLLWIRGIIIKNDLWCWNEAKPLLPGTSPNTLVSIHVDRHGDRVMTNNLIVKQFDRVRRVTSQLVAAHTVLPF